METSTIAGIFVTLFAGFSIVFILGWRVGFEVGANFWRDAYMQSKPTFRYHALLDENKKD